MSTRLAALAAGLVLSLSASLATAKPHELRIPLNQGRLDVAHLSTELQHRVRLPITFAIPGNIKEVDLNSAKGSLFLTAINAALDGAARVDISDDTLVLSYDADQFPRDTGSVRRSIRSFAAGMAPDAAAAQARTFGLTLPQEVDPARRMVVLVHGLDSDRSNWTPIAILLENEGYQVAYFTYPSDQSIADSAALLTRHMRALRETFPDLPTSIVAHSMGSLVSRAYVEGDSYAGGVDHFVMLAPPNHGSRWAKYRLVLEAQEHLGLARQDDDWHPVWLVTDGLGEAGADLNPKSRFLTTLNSLPRRDGVKYTIVAGNQHPAYRMGANALDTTSRWIPRQVRGVWGFRQTFAAAQNASRNLRHKTGKHDGPISVKSTRLPGVDDFVVVAADHQGLQTGSATAAPAAWDILRDRLAQ